jgi:tetratricopeptide (TPR) repeat protein
MTTAVAEQPSKLQTGTTDERPALAHKRWTSHELGWLLVAVVAVVYWSSLPGAFVFDDLLQIVDNPKVHQLWPLADWQRPVGYFTFQLNYALGRLDPRGYHVVNVLIHCLNGLLVLGIARRLLAPRGTVDGPVPRREDRLALAIALVWSVHPLTTSAVTIVVQRLESLMALWFLACVYALIRSHSSPRPKVWLTLSVIAMSLGVLTKEVMVTCLPVVLLVDRGFLADSWRGIWQQRRWYYAALAAPLLWIVITSQLVDPEEYSAGFSYRGVTPWEYLRSQPLVLLHYLQLTFWPDQLVIDYGWPVEHSALRIYLPGALLLALLGCSLWLMFKHPRVGCLALSIFVILGPSSSIMPIADLCFEHRMYLPLILVVALVVVGIDALLRRLLSARRAQVVSAGLLIGVVCALGLRTIQRNRDFYDPIQLWEQNVAVRPEHARPHLLLGILYSRAGRSDDAGNAFKAAVAIRPDYVKGLLNLGTWYLREQDYAAAADTFQRVISLDPGLAAGYANHGRALLELGDSTAAQKSLEEALSRHPSEPVACRTLAWLLVTADNDEQRDVARALSLLRRLPPDPAQRDVWRLDILAAAEAEQGRFEQADATQELAIARAQEQRRPEDYLQKLERRAAVYRQQRPWRSSDRDAERGESAERPKK